MDNLVYTLLLASNQKCVKCLSLATHILIGRENEFIGFYCQLHGEEQHTALESKFNFEANNRWTSIPKKRRKVKWNLKPKN